MVLLKLHWDVTDATLSALVAMVSGGRGGGSLTRLTEPPVEAKKCPRLMKETGTPGCQVSMKQLL